MCKGISFQENQLSEPIKSNGVNTALTQLNKPSKTLEPNALLYLSSGPGTDISQMLLIPEIYYDDHTIYFEDTSHVAYTLKLV